MYADIKIDRIALIRETVITKAIEIFQGQFRKLLAGGPPFACLVREENRGSKLCQTMILGTVIRGMPKGFLPFALSLRPAADFEPCPAELSSMMDQIPKGGWIFEREGSYRDITKHDHERCSPIDQSSWTSYSTPSVLNKEHVAWLEKQHGIFGA